jgi:ABC-type multidrug transport system permease subunit
MLILKLRFFKTILASIISPVLFLLAFGFGIGKNTHINGTDYLSFLLPGLLTMSSLNQAYGISSEINISRFYFKIFDEYLLAPVGRWQIVAGEALYGITKGLISAIIVIAIALAVKVKLYISPIFILILFIHLIIFSLLGLIAALLVKNHGDQFAINTFIITPMVFLSGTFYPVDSMHFFIKWVVHLFPLTYTTALLRDALLYDTLHSILYLIISLIILLALFIIALFVIKRVEV